MFSRINLFANRVRWLPILAYVFMGMTSPALGALHSDSELGIYRFFSMLDKDHASVAAYKLEDGFFIPKQVGALSLNDPSKAKSNCAGLLDRLQEFSLRVMQGLGYLTEEELKFHGGVIKDLHPEQVTFIELSRPVLRTEVEANPATYKPGQISLRPDIERPNHVHVKQGALWVISGQAMYPHSKLKFMTEHRFSADMQIPWKAHIREANPARLLEDPRQIIVTLNAMPWQNDNRHIKEGGLKASPFGYAELDRKKYPMVWELGRAAQIEPENLETMMQAAMTVISEEIEVMLQSEPDQAYVFVHALDKLRMRRFRQDGFVPLEGACLSPGECVMVAPFLKLAEKYAPGHLSGRLHKIRKALKDRVTLPDAMNYLRRIHAYFRAELDLILPQYGLHQETPIVMHDFSRNYYFMLQAMAERKGLTHEEAKAFADDFGIIRNDSGVETASHQHMIPAAPFVQEFYERNVVRLTNLDPALAIRSEYLPAILIGTYNYLAARYKEIGVTNGPEVLDKTKTKIAIQTTSTLMASRARYIGGMPMDPLFDQNGKTIYTVLFDTDQIHQMQKMFPKIDAADGGIAQGFWFFRRINAHPLKF